MPLRKSEHLVGFANHVQSTFLCDSCGHRTTYDTELLEETLQCRNCRTRNQNLLFASYNTRCQVCSKQMKQPVVRPGLTDHHKFCAECARAFDTYINEWEQLILGEAISELRNRMIPSPPKDPAPLKAGPLLALPSSPPQTWQSVSCKQACHINGGPCRSCPGIKQLVKPEKPGMSSSGLKFQMALWWAYLAQRGEAV